MKHTFKKLLIAMLVLCTFVGVLPMLAADDITAQAAAADIYYDFKKANTGWPTSAEDKVTYFTQLTYDEVAARNSTITSGPWAYHSYSETVASNADSTNATAFTSNSFCYYYASKSYGISMYTGARHGVLKAGIKFKGFNTGKYVPYLNINGAHLRAYSGTLTAKIYPLTNGTLGSAIVTKELFLSDYPEDDTYVQLSNAVSLTASEYVLELTINNERTMVTINGLQLVAADTAFVSSIYPTNHEGVYEVKVGSSYIDIPFTQLMSDGTTSTSTLSGWSATSSNTAYATTEVRSSSRVFRIRPVAATDTPITMTYKIGTYAVAKINVIVRAADYSPPTSDLYYDFTKVLPANLTVNHVHNIAKFIDYKHTAVGAYSEINKYTGTASDTSVHSYPWKISSIASTVTFSPMFHNYGIQSKNYGVTDVKIRVPSSGVYMPQLEVDPTNGINTPVTISIINSSGTTLSTMTVPAGTKTTYNLDTAGITLSAQEYTIRFNKTTTGSSADAGANYYNGIRFVKTSNTTITLNPNGGTAGSKTSVVAANGFPMPGVDDGLPTRTGYRFGGYFSGRNGVLGTGTQYYTMAGKSNHDWDKTSSTATLYASWNVNTYHLVFNANGGSGTMSNQSINYDVEAAITANTFTRTGYTFAGWATSASGSVKYEDEATVKNLSATNQAKINLYAVWTPNTYSVKYNANGGSGTMSNSSHTYDTAKALTANAFTKTGYTFQGWDTSSAGTTVVYTDKKSVSNLTSTNGGTVNLYAVWKGNEYAVTFDFTNGSGGTASTTATYGSAMPKVTPPTKTGFTFAGYYDATSGGTKYYNADGTSARTWNKTAETTLYARWTRNTYAVTLDANGGTEGTTSVTASYNLAMPAIETLPTRTGYTFAGYYDATSGGTQYYKEDGTSARTWNKAAAATLYARWTANTYTVTFDKNGGGTPSPATIDVTYDSTYGTLATVSRTGYTFAGWYTAASGGTKVTSSTKVTITAAQTLYAHWTANTYTVAYNGNGNTGGSTASSSHTYDTAKALTANGFSRSGYTFNGWNTEADGSGTAYANSASVKNLATSGTVTLYAQWEIVNYTITYNLNSGTQGSGAVTDYNVTTATFNLPTPTRTGYTFGGWYTASNFSGTAVTQIAKGSTGNKTFYAKWTANTYTVTLNANGGTGGTASVTATYDSAMPQVTAPTRTGFTLVGYYDATSGGTKYYNADGTSARTWNKTEETTLYARWTRNTYAVTLSANGGTEGTTSVTASYNLAMPTIEILPTRIGYTFAGYYDATSGGTQYYNADGTSARTWNKASAATLYARWTANTYTITLDDGTSTTTVTATYGSLMPEITKPQAAGKVFGGYWTEENGGGEKYYATTGTSSRNWNIAEDTTLYAYWTAATVTLTNPGDKSVTAENQLTFSISGSTNSGMGVTYSATNLPSGATFSGDTFTWTPTIGQIGTYDVTFKAVDGDRSASRTITITVNAPQFTVSLSEGGTVEVTYGVAMPEITAPTKTGFVFAGYFDGENGTGTQYYNADGTSARNWNKTEAVTLYAKWIQGEVTITQIGDKTVAVEEELTFNVEATTTAPDDITYTAENLPDGAIFNETTGEFSWTPTTEQVGEYTIIFRGSDGVNYAEVTVKVVVTEILSTITLDDGTNTTEIRAIYDEELPAITAPVKEGFMFDGYYDGENGTGTKYYNIDGTPTRIWDKKETSVTLYAKWIEGDERLGRNLGVIRNKLITDAEGNERLELDLLAGVDSLKYNEIGFEVTIDGETVRQGTHFVYQTIKDSKKTYTPADFGSLCKHAFIVRFNFPTSYKAKNVTLRPYAIDFEGNIIYGKQITVPGIHTKL